MNSDWDKICQKKIYFLSLAWLLFRCNDKRKFKHFCNISLDWRNTTLYLTGWYGLDSIAASVFVDCLSLTNTESEANPNNNLMMRRAGLSNMDWKCPTKVPHYIPQLLRLRRWEWLPEKFLHLGPSFLSIVITQRCKKW